MRIIRGDRWWKTRCLLGPFEASGLMAMVGLAVGIGCAMAVEAPYLIPIGAVVCGLAPFCLLPKKRARWDTDFDRRFHGTCLFLLVASLIASLWAFRYQIAGFPKAVYLVVAFILSCVLLATHTIWGLILAFREMNKPEPGDSTGTTTIPEF